MAKSLWKSAGPGAGVLSGAPYYLRLNIDVAELAQVYVDRVIQWHPQFGALLRASVAHVERELLCGARVLRPLNALISEF